MIYNKQIAQSYVLFTVLRQQRERITKKLNTIQQLKYTIQWMQNEIQKKYVDHRQRQLIRKQISILLKEQLIMTNSKNNQIVEENQKQLQILRKNLNTFRNFRNTLTKEKQYLVFINQQESILKHKQEQIDSNIKVLQKQHLVYQLQKSQLTNQQQALKGRMKQIVEQQLKKKQIYTQILYKNKLFQNVVNNSKQANQKLYNQFQDIQKQFKNISIENYQNQQYIEKLKFKQNLLKQQIITAQQQSDIVRIQSEELQRKIQEKEAILNIQSQQCRKINGQIIMRSAQSNMIQRGLRLKQNQVECLKMLINKLCHWKCQLVEYQVNKKEESCRRTALVGNIKDQCIVDCLRELNSN